MKVICASIIFLFLLRTNGIHIQQNKIRKEANTPLSDHPFLKPLKKKCSYQRLHTGKNYYYINNNKESEEKKKGKELFTKINISHRNQKEIFSFPILNKPIHILHNINKLNYIGSNVLSTTLKNVENVKNVKTIRYRGDVFGRMYLHGGNNKVTGIKKKRFSSILKGENNQINLSEKPIIEKVPKNVKGRLNEWLTEFDEDNTLGFFPILLEEMSNEPAPLQIGFEDYLQFNGENVEEIFKSVTKDVVINNEKKKIFGMCFFNHKTGILAPLGVYAEIKDVTKIGNNLAVKGLVRGRVIIDEIIKQEPFILAKISEIEDKKGLVDEEESLKIADEIIRTHSQCTNMESQLMEQLDNSLASMNIKLRNDLKESIDTKLEKFQIDISDPKQRQSFIQIVAFCAFDFHLMIVDRYDALMLQNSEDRLRFVRDKIRQKQKQLAIIKNTPKEKLQQILEQVQTMKNQPNIPNIPSDTPKL